MREFGMKPALVFAGTASTERRGRCGPGGLFDSELYLMAIAFGIGRCKSYCSSYVPKSVGYLKTELIEGYQADATIMPIR